MYDDNNIFAKIIRGEMPAFKVFEDARAVAFMDAMPQSDGHTLVVPKAKARNFFDIEPAVLAELIQATAARRARRAEGVQPGGMRIVQFNEAVAGQTVFHIHFTSFPATQRRAAHPQPRLGGQRLLADTPSAYGSTSRQKPRLLTALSKGLGRFRPEN